MQIEIAQLSLIGDRADNQDRVQILVGNQTVFAAVVDGMGGHADGARAAEVACATMAELFRNEGQPLADGAAFLETLVSEAHRAVVAIGDGVPRQWKPRATCAACIAQQGSGWWVHVGDSRVYHLRDNRMVSRTRDHTHVESMLREGLITEEQVASHPMRSYVEHCLGGTADAPPLVVGGPVELVPGDVLLVCSDGLWSALEDEQIAAAFEAGFEQLTLQQSLERLVGEAVRANHPGSDNTTAAVVHWLTG